MMECNRKVMIAVTDNRGIDPTCAHGLMTNTASLVSAGWAVEPFFLVGDCYIERARTVCCKHFLDGDFSDIVFIDSDVGFPEKSILKLLSYNVGVVGGAYPRRGPFPGKFIVKEQTDEAGRPIGNALTRLISCEWIGAGLLRINRSVFKAIMEKHPEIFMKDIWWFFQTGFLLGENWLGEDVYFCKLCQSAGIDVWCDPDIDLKHSGRSENHGNFHQYLLSQPPVEVKP